MKLIGVLICLLVSFILILNSNWVSFVSYNQQGSNSINLSKKSITTLDNLELSFFRIEPIDNNELIYDLILDGKYDDSLKKIANHLKGNHYVSIAPIINADVKWNVYSNKILKETYLKTYNYIAYILTKHAKGKLTFVFEVAVAPSWFRYSTLPFSFYDRRLNCDVVGLNFNSIDSKLLVNALNIETILDIYLEENVSKFNTHFALIDIPDSLLNKSFTQQLATGLREYSVVIGHHSFFSYYNLGSYYQRLIFSVRVSLFRMISFIRNFFSSMKPIQGSLFYEGAQDYDFEMSVGDDYLEIKIMDDDKINYTVDSNFYDRIYICDDITTRVKEGYMLYKEKNGFSMIDLETFDKLNIFMPNEIKSINNLKIPLNKLNNCNDFFANPVQIIDYDKKNKFTVLHYMN